MIIWVPREPLISDCELVDAGVKPGRLSAPARWDKCGGWTAANQQSVPLQIVADACSRRLMNTVGGKDFLQHFPCRNPDGSMPELRGVARCPQPDGDSVFGKIPTV